MILVPFLLQSRMVELGAVDQNGISLDKLNISRPSFWACMHGQRSPSEAATILDM